MWKQKRIFHDWNECIYQNYIAEASKLKMMEPGSPNTLSSFILTQKRKRQFLNFSSEHGNLFGYKFKDEKP